MPHIPAPTIVNREITLPAGSGNTFWLKNQVWEIPNLGNVDTFVEHLVRAGALTRDPLVEAVLRDELPNVSPRTVRHRFQHSTGMRQNYIRQIERAQCAVERLRQGHSILDTAYELGYADQPHLTRSLKRFLGYSPRKLLTAASQMA